MAARVCGGQVIGPVPVDCVLAALKTNSQRPHGHMVRQADFYLVALGVRTDGAALAGLGHCLTNAEMYRVFPLVVDTVRT
jgi:hypothetical protein